jgi:hypothetical protein
VSHLSRKSIFEFSLALAVSFCGWPVSAADLSEPELLRRCYVHIAGRPVPRDSAAMARVRAGTSSAMQECQALIDKVELPQGGGTLVQQDPESVAILNNFYNFHRTWFAANTVEQIQTYNDQFGLGTTDIYDATEPGLALTRALFTQGAKYSEVLTLPTGVHAIRVQDQGVRTRLGFTVDMPGRRKTGNDPRYATNTFSFHSLTDIYQSGAKNTSFLIANVPTIEVGDLTGIRPTTESFTFPNVDLKPLNELPGNKEAGLNYSFDVFKTYGGGILGTPIYFLLNYGQTFNTPSNGTTKLPRHWALENMRAFLCRSVPALRDADVTQFLVPTSTAPFRTSTSCLKCHATLDQMGYTARNLAMVSTDYDAAIHGDKTAMVAVSYRPEFPSSSGWPSEPVENFHRQNPSGRLFFRSVSGKLVDIPLQNLSELGTALTTVPDYYQCAAKRYFEYLTGISIPLYDRGDPLNKIFNAALTTRDVANIKFVADLGADLQKTQSLKSLLKSILNSPYYRSANFQPAEGSP